MRGTKSFGLGNVLAWTVAAWLTWSGWGFAGGTAGAEVFKVASRQSLPARPLRGYGWLAGQFVKYAVPGGRFASQLTIDTPSPERAAIVLAKYNSDLRELGGITESNLVAGSHTVPVAMTENQGAIAAFREGAMVIIAAADNPGDLVKLPALAGLGTASPDFTGGKVPVYLDVFDQHGFSFGFYGWDAPWKLRDTFDYRAGFAFAKKYGLTLHHQVEANPGDTAEGVMDWPRFEAAVDIARRMGIPSYIGTWGKSGPAWLMNRYAGQMQMPMPDFTGGLYGPGYDHANFPVSYPATFSAAQDALFEPLAQVVRKYSSYENVTGYLEPHEEAANPTLAIMTEYGPAADDAFRGFLNQKYHSPAAVAHSWHNDKIAAWKNIQVPEVASFIGWGSGAFDLKGPWQTVQDASLPPADLVRWDAVNLDDSKWKRLVAPGDDHALFRPATHAPGVFRRTFDLPAEALARLKAAGDGRIFLYVWDMEGDPQRPLEAALNGTVAGTFKNPVDDLSWCAFEVAQELRAGTNLVALHLPFGELCYKVYLSPVAPRCYPDLAPGEDARWVDFRDFVTWTQAEGVRRGMEMIRREDPDRFIRLPHPDPEQDVEKALAEDYGGEFHNTGYMSGDWHERLPALMRSSGLPCSLEPGGAAGSLAELESEFGRWLTEGVNAVDYYPNIWGILQDPDLLAWFDAHQPLVHLIGKYHGDRAAVAVLDGEESIHLTGFPWDVFSNDLTWGRRSGPFELIGDLPAPCDMLLDSDFARGNARKYHVIVDDNTLVMDDQLIDSIGKWVRAGGIFITYGHSGQHSPLAANAWPISRLTGYQVTGANDNWGYRVIPGQTVLNGPLWTAKDADGQSHRFGGSGLFLRKTAPECRDVLAWEGGKGIALGVRPLGRGYVVADACCTPPEAWPDILRWCGVPVRPLTANSCRVSRFVSNNGLDDVLVLWGEQIKSAVTVTLLAGGCRDTTMRDVESGLPVSGLAVSNGVVFSQLKFDPLETRAFLVPRHAITQAPLEWLNLQRDWWQGTRKPSPLPPEDPFTNTVDLTLDNAFSPVPEEATNMAPWVAATIDDSRWPRLDLGIWSAAYPELTRGVFRKTFTVPAGWSSGRSWIWLHAWDAFALRPPYQAQAYLDGKLIWTAHGKYDQMSVDVTAALKTGRHVLALMTTGNTTMNGFLGNAWVEHLPAPVITQPLAGNWGPGLDLPGSKPLAGACRTFMPDPAGRGKTALLFADGGALIAGIFINGHWIGRSPWGDHFTMNLTPFIRWNAENEIELRPVYLQPTTVSRIEIRYYDADGL